MATGLDLPSSCFRFFVCITKSVGPKVPQCRREKSSKERQPEVARKAMIHAANL